MKLFFTRAPEVEIPFQTFRFSGGEMHFRLTMSELLGVDMRSGTPGGLTIVAKLRNGDDVMRLLMARDAIARSCGADYPVRLTMAYTPYARQDRVCNEGEALAVSVFANLINGLAFREVTILDPHSDVTPALIRNVSIVKQRRLVELAVAAGLIPGFETLLVVAPDIGAMKKIRELPGEKVVCDKIRRLEDGKILGIKIADGNPAGRDCLIVDDICDGGRTFVETAKALKDAGARSVKLFVTHGIFSAGLDELRRHLDGIITTDSWCDAGTDDGFVKVLKTEMSFA